MSTQIYTVGATAICRGCRREILKGTPCMKVYGMQKTLYVCAKCVKLAAQQLEETENETDN